MISLAADIGGTYSRLAWSGDGPAQGADEQIFRNADFDSLEAVIDRALAVWSIAGQPLDHIALAVPGPVHDDPVALTNIDWQLDREALRSRYRAARLSIVNDFQAAALGSVAEPRERLMTLNPGVADTGPVVVAGAGTGLGMAWFAGQRSGVLPYATEGGHLDFAPVDDEQLALFHWLAERYGHVSYERILSGAGLLDTHRFIAADAAGAGTPAEVVAAARRGDVHALQTVRTFVAIFAAYAGNLALAFNPTGGIYLCGGLTVHLAEWFNPELFQARYMAKGRMRAVVQRIPVFMVNRHDTGLTGAKMIAENFTGQTYEQ